MHPYCASFPCGGGLGHLNAEGWGEAGRQVSGVEVGSGVGDTDKTHSLPRVCRGWIGDYSSRCGVGSGLHEWGCAVGGGHRASQESHFTGEKWMCGMCQVVFFCSLLPGSLPLLLPSAVLHCETHRPACVNTAVYWLLWKCKRSNVQRGVVNVKYRNATVWSFMFFVTFKRGTLTQGTCEASADRLSPDSPSHLAGVPVHVWCRDQITVWDCGG